MNKHLLSIFDLTQKEVWEIISLAIKLKSGKSNTNHLAGKTLGMILEKPSTRTTVSFSVAMYQLGGFPLILDAKNLQRKRGETIHDTAKVLSGYIDGLMMRALSHKDVEEFAQHSTIPIINGLTDKEHPCQILGDLQTIVEANNIKSIEALKKIKVVFVGDGNNVANSLMGAAAVVGFDYVLARPSAIYNPDRAIFDNALAFAKVSGAKIDIMSDPKEAVKNADLIYTDVWTSMGEESQRDQRLKDFAPYQVNKTLLSYAKPTCKVMHCLPAIRGEEITSEVMDGPQSVIFEEAENRLHIQKAVLIKLMGK
jgi:ornithine carbamoyltransferase